MAEHQPALGMPPALWSFRPLLAIHDSRFLPAMLRIALQAGTIHHSPFVIGDR
jgi:hypothetical protein